MSLCLVQQLFRQKIGKELDPSIVDEVLFPLLRPRKHGPKELLQDIKLATDTLIITDYARCRAGRLKRRQPARREERHLHFSVPTFTPIPEYWTYFATLSESYLPVGQRTSKFRRKKIRNDDWGTIDILNELRGIDYPQAGYKPRSYVIEEPVDYEDAYICLAEDNSLPATIRWGVDHSRQNAILIDSRSQFVNNILDDVLLTDKRLNWSYERGHHLGGILSIEESSQHGSVQNQLY